MTGPGDAGGEDDSTVVSEEGVGEYRRSKVTEPTEELEETDRLDCDDARPPSVFESGSHEYCVPSPEGGKCEAGACAPVRPSLSLDARPLLTTVVQQTKKDAVQSMRTLRDQIEKSRPLP